MGVRCYLNLCTAHLGQRTNAGVFLGGGEFGRKLFFLPILSLLGSFLPRGTSSLALDFFFSSPFWLLQPPHLRSLLLTFVLRCPCPRLGDPSTQTHSPRPPSSVPLPLRPARNSSLMTPAPLAPLTAVNPCPRHPPQRSSRKHTYIAAFRRHLLSPDSPRCPLPPRAVPRSWGLGGERRHSRAVSGGVIRGAQPGAGGGGRAARGGAGSL